MLLIINAPTYYVNVTEIITILLNMYILHMMSWHISTCNYKFTDREREWDRPGDIYTYMYM